MTSRGLFFVCLAQLFVLQHQQQAVNEVIMLTPPGMNYFPEQWLAGVRLAEGGVVYISNRIELAVVNNDIYTFQSNNLYYYDMTVSVFLTYLIPGHTPQTVVAVEDQVWVTTDNCVLALNLSAAAHIVLGNCYEPNMMRDGPPLFARFTQIQAIVGIPALRLTLVLDAGTRLCQLQREGWVSSQLLPRTAQALAADSDPQEQIWWALAWEDGVSFGLWPALASTNATWQAGRSFRSLAFVFNAALPGVAYLYTVESKAVQRLMLNATSVLQSTTLFSAAGGADLTAISLDIPYGVYVLDSAKTGFSRIKNLGCLCPPGYAVLDVETDHCQPAPMGGYVDVMGNFIPCPPGTYGVFAQATAEEACTPCPPHTISAEPQSAFCMPCAPGQVQNPERTACVTWCPNGTVASNGGCVPMCPKAGYTFSSAKQGCVPCPPNTSRSVTDEDCRPCAVGTFSEQGSATCLPICSAGTYLPDNGASCVPWAQELSVFTIAVLGVHPVDMAVADNGTVYVAAFQVLILVDRSGSSTQIFLPEFGMVRSLALSWDQRVLYAAVNQDHVMCLSSLPMMLTKSSWVLLPGSITVGLRLTSSFAVVVWDAATNAIFQVKKKDGSVRQWLQGRPDAMIMAMHSLPTSDLVWVMLQDPVRGNQSILQLQPTSVAVVYQTLKESAWNPYMTTLWNQNSSLVLSSENMLLIPQQGVVGQPNGTGRVDSSTRQTARFTQPGPMVQAPNPNMLLVADQTSLRVVWWGNMRCASSFFDDGQHCAACPVGLSSMPGAQSCTPCTEGQYNDAVTGACVPCPRIRWWPAERSTCSEFIDTMVAADAVGLSWQDIVSEAAGGVAMGTRDYVSLQTLILPLTKDAVLLNTAAQSRFWSRLQRVTPPPFMFNSLMQSRLPVLLPGFWVECSQYVLQSETCVCDLPAGGIVLGNTDMTQLWNRARADASLVDYSTLQIQIPPDPDLYVGGQTEAIYFVNMSVSLTSLFVSRTDAGGGTDDDNPSVFFLKTVSEPISIAVPPPTVPTPSESSFSACVAGWPATYLCPPGFVWVPSVFVCMPCKAGYYFDSPEQHCKPCSVGSYNPSLGSTACLACDLARITGASRCNSSSSSSSVQPSLTCGPGNEVRGGRCLPCLPGFASSMGQGVVCSACPPGKYANAAGRTACSPCTRPLVSAQWASSGCMACTAGYVASAQGDACQACIAGQQYFFNTRPYPSCVNKTVLKCGSGYYLQDGGPMSDNVCVACAPCAEGQVMLPFDANPCSYKETSVLGPPYRCVPVMSVAGQFSSLSLLLQSSTFTVQYTPCQGLPPFAWWSVGPEPSMCFFQCLYAIAGPIARQYLFYYGMEKPDAVTQHMLGRLPSNVFPLDYPGLGVGLMLMAQKVCMPCPTTQCGWGVWRPILNGGCGPPMCQIQTTCQIMEAGPVVYEADGCTQPCSHPPNSHLTGVAPVGMGDACPWECDFAYFLSQKVVDADQNETASICLPCGPEACIPGLEEYHATLCTPKGNRSAFCLPCPLPSLYSRRVDGTAGQCQYECLPNISYRSSVDQQCKPCITAFCPPGFRRVCAENACVPCPPLYTSSVVLMPSDNYTCQASCKSGYLSLSNTNDVATIACVPCAQRPALPCPSISDCPPGYSYMPSPLDFCQKNPSVYDCGLGMYPSPSVCVECPRPLPGRIPILPSQADTIHLDSLVCPSVCPPQYAGATVCIQCSTLNTQGFSFYALWNASNGTRWWPPAQDALMPHLPPRPATGTERRAGICWPCPQGWITLDSDLDLCLTVSTFSQVVVPTIVSPNVVLSQDSRLPVSRSVPRTITGRRLLLSPFSQMRFLCPVFSSASGGSCSCNPGFRYTRATGTCAPVPLTGATSKVMRVRAGPDGTSLVLFSEEARHKRSGLRTRRSLLLLPDHHCGPGSQPEPSGCAPCPLGTYSPYHGMGPCLPCPTNSTTSREGSVTAAECVVPRVADSVFL